MHRARDNRNTLNRPTDAQYRLLRYWAGNVVNNHGFDANLPPFYVRIPGRPLLQTKTVNIVQARRWMFRHPRAGWIVTDAGRAAVNLPAVHRDHGCPLPGCDAECGERCVDLDAMPYVERGRRWWPYTDAVHDVRIHRDVYLRLQREHPMSGPRDVERMMRAEIAAARSADLHAADVHRAMVEAATAPAGHGVAGRPIDLSGPIGYVYAT